MDLQNIFSYHPPQGDQVERYNRLRTAALVFAQAIVDESPAGADQTDAIRSVRNAVMTANAAIALDGRL